MTDRAAICRHDVEEAAVLLDLARDEPDRVHLTLHLTPSRIRGTLTHDRAVALIARCLAAGVRVDARPATPLDPTFDPFEVIVSLTR